MAFAGAAFKNHYIKKHEPLAVAVKQDPQRGDQKVKFIFLIFCYR